MERCLAALADPESKASAAAKLPLPLEISAARLTKLSLFHRRTLRCDGPCLRLRVAVVLPEVEAAVPRPVSRIYDGKEWKSSSLSVTVMR